jgi:hypothetical protein
MLTRVCKLQRIQQLHSDVDRVCVTQSIRQLDVNTTIGRRSKPYSGSKNIRALNVTIAGKSCKQGETYRCVVDTVPLTTPDLPLRVNRTTGRNLPMMEGQYTSFTVMTTLPAPTAVALGSKVNASTVRGDVCRGP